MITLQVDVKSRALPSCLYYYDMKYSVDYSTFSSLETSKLSCLIKSMNEFSKCGNFVILKEYGELTLNYCVTC